MSPGKIPFAVRKKSQSQDFNRGFPVERVVTSFLYTLDAATATESEYTDDVFTLQRV
jgi:hypothetical protein